jgi:ferredoxin
MNGRTTPRISVDREACAGHGRCYAVAPELFEPDEEGFSVVVGEADDEELRAELDKAARNCPEGAILVSTDE